MLLVFCSGGDKNKHDQTSAQENDSAGVFVGKGGNGISLFTTPRDKRLSYTTHPASKYKESQTAVQTQHLNLTTKILSMSTIKLRMAAVPLNSFVL